MREKEGYNNTLYYPHVTTDAWKGTYGYWLSSPDGSGQEDVLTVLNRGRMLGGRYIGEVFVLEGLYDRPWVGYSVRPVVCLSSEVQGIQGENEIWILSK